MLKNILSLFLVLSLIFLSIQFESASNVKDQSDGQFSALAVKGNLEEIAKAPHPIGSTENQRVRDYIITQLEKEGLDVKIESGYTMVYDHPQYTRMAFVENIVATLKGTDPNGKKVVIAGHYDSVFEGPGAADDGYAVACMIETVRLLKNESRKNDIELVITDGEEMGLLGAAYHVQNHDMKDVGLVLNFEARGNQGPGIAFEWSDNNAWLVKEMAKVSERPIANSLSYEIYKRMPNGTDFTEFLSLGVDGVNYAFIDGFSYYHNPVDAVENISWESVQHTGENMYLMTKHFSNFDFGNAIKKGNASFFNFYGHLIYYPERFDFFILVLGFLLCAFLTYQKLRVKSVKPVNILAVTLAIIGTILICGLLNFGLAYLVKMAYPQYATFYTFQFYNHEWYLLAGLGLTVITCWIIGKYLLQKANVETVGIATLIVLMILSIVVFKMMPTATYTMIFPLVALVICLLLLNNLKLEKKDFAQWMIAMVTLAVFIGMWTMLSHNLFLAFSLNALPGAVIPTALFCFASMSLIPELWQKKTYLLSIFGGSLFIFSIVFAHFTASPSPNKPWKSNLFYAYDQSADQGYWASKDRHLNIGHLGLLDGADNQNLPNNLAFSRFTKPANLDVKGLISNIHSDTLLIDNRSSKTIVHPRKAGKIFIHIDDVSNVDSLFLDGQLNMSFDQDDKGYYFSVLFGIGLDSLKIEMVKKNTNLPIPVRVNMDYRELPIDDKLPLGIVRNNGFTLISHLVNF